MYTSLATVILLLAPAQQDPGESVPYLSDIPLLGELFVTQGVVPDPDLRWNGTTEDIYRRALHLIQVRAKYQDGADLLLGIADSAEVIQIPGQSSWVLGQAALALAQAGAQSDAEALVPGILNGSRGTKLEAQVDVLLQRLSSQLKQDHQLLDDNFRQFLWDRLQAYPSSSGDSGSDVLDYGRLALPYLEEIIRSQLALGAAGHPGDIGQAKKATWFATRLATDAFAGRLLALLAEYPPLTTRVLLAQSASSRREDVQASEAMGRFFLQLAESKDPEVARLGFSSVVARAQSSGQAELIESLRRTAGSGSDDQFELIARALSDGDLYTPETWAAFHDECAESGPPMLREAARWSMVGQPHHRARLRGYAESGERREVLRYLTNFAVPTPPDQQAGRPQSSFSEAAALALAEEGAYDWLSGRGGMRFEGADSATVARFAASADSGIRALAVLAALKARETALLHEVFVAAAPDSREELLRELKSGYTDYGEAMAHALLEAAIAGSEQAREWLANTGMRHLAVSELVASGLSWNAHSSAGYGWQQFGSFRHQAGDFEALAELASLPEIVPAIRRSTLNGLSNNREHLLKALLSASEWRVDAEEAENLFRDCVDYLRDQERGRDSGLNPDVSPELAESIVHVIWDAIGADKVSYERSQIQHLLSCHWRTAPERAYELALQLIHDEEDLALYKKRSVVGGGGSVWPQRLAFELVDRGIWDLRERTVTWLGAEEEPEFEALLRKMFAVPEARWDAFSQLSWAEPKWREVFADEIAAGWKHPEHAAYIASKFYMGTSEIKNKVPQLLAAWELEGVENRPGLLQAMGETLDERVVPILLEELGSPDGELRSAAKTALERIREVQEQRDFWEAWEATGSSLSPTVALIQKLKSDKQMVRIAAIQSLGTLKAPEALPFLVELLEDDDAKIRDAAAAALAKINAE